MKERSRSSRLQKFFGTPPSANFSQMPNSNSFASNPGEEHINFEALEEAQPEKINNQFAR